MSLYICSFLVITMAILCFQAARKDYEREKFLEGQIMCWIMQVLLIVLDFCYVVKIIQKVF